MKEAFGGYYVDWRFFCTLTEEEATQFIKSNLNCWGYDYDSEEIQEIYEQYFGHCDKDKKEDCKKKEKCCETVCPFCNMPLDLCECLEDD